MTVSVLARSEEIVATMRRDAGRIELGGSARASSRASTGDVVTLICSYRDIGMTAAAFIIAAAFVAGIGPFAGARDIGQPSGTGPQPVLQRSAAGEAPSQLAVLKQ